MRPEDLIMLVLIAVFVIYQLGKARGRRPRRLPPVVRPVQRPPLSRTPAPPTTPATPLGGAQVPILPREIRGRARVIDGDTIVIRATRIRLAGIDAAELEHPWGVKSKYALVALCRGQEVIAEVTGDLSYERLVARCRLADGTDLAAELVRQGLALDWPAFSGGRYSALEPHGIRKKLWRAAARQRGDMRAFATPVQPRRP